MGVGLAIVKWPILVQNAASLPVFEGVVTCLLTAMSLLAFLGLRYPIRMLPILLFEVLWKVIWIAAVAVPHLIADDINAATGAVLVNCSLVVIIIAVIPWPHVSGALHPGTRGCLAVTMRRGMGELTSRRARPARGGAVRPGRRVQPDGRTSPPAGALYLLPPGLRNGTRPDRPCQYR